MHIFIMDSKLKTSRVVLFLLLVCLQAYFLFGLKVKDFQCRRRLYYTNVSWYTAYDICKENKMELERLDKNIPGFSYILKAHINDVFKFLKDFNKSELEVWIGGLVRTSTNESMDSHCKFLNHHFSYTLSREEILCVYFDVSTDEFHTANCSNSKSFLCVIPKYEESNCLIPTNKTTANSLLCKNFKGNRNLTETMEQKLTGSDENYAITFNSTNYELYQYQATGCDKALQIKAHNMENTSLSKIPGLHYYFIKFRNEAWVGFNFVVITPTSHITSHAEAEDVLMGCYWANILIRITPYIGENGEGDRREIRRGTFIYLDPPLKPSPQFDICPAMTPERLQEKIEIIQKNLTVGRKNTTKYQRTLTSAPDERPSSKYMGVTGVLIICLVAGFIILIDLSNFFKRLKPVRVKIE